LGSSGSTCKADGWWLRYAWAALLGDKARASVALVEPMKIEDELNRRYPVSR